MDVTTLYFKCFGDHQKQMAASIESLEFCEKIIEINGINSILDCGSGLSTVFFNSKYTNVTTIEDSVYWAEKTTDFMLSDLNLKIDILSIAQIMGQKFDFVFYDLGDMETRIYYLKFILQIANNFIYLDDMHIEFYRIYVKSLIRNRYDLEIFDNVKDQFGRYGGLISLQ